MNSTDAPVPVNFPKLTRCRGARTPNPVCEGFTYCLTTGRLPPTARRRGQFFRLRYSLYISAHRTQTEASSNDARGRRIMLCHLTGKR
jgi:hypothetical protein